MCSNYIPLLYGVMWVWRLVNICVAVVELHPQKMESILAGGNDVGD